MIELSARAPVPAKRNLEGATLECAENEVSGRNGHVWTRALVARIERFDLGMF